MHYMTGNENKIAGWYVEMYTSGSFNPVQFCQ